MRHVLLMLPATLAGLCISSEGNSREVSTTLASRYIDINNFNDVFSNDPSLQLEASQNLNAHLYISGYAYTGLKKPFADASSEYGFEAGGKWELSKKATFTLSAGRYADYQGRGFRAGDWYLKAGVSYRCANLSVSVLRGVSDTVLINGSCELPVKRRITVTPSVAYFTEQKKLNPGLALRYQFSEKVSVGAKFVLPKDDTTGKRKFYGAATLTVHF